MREQARLRCFCQKSSGRSVAVRLQSGRASSVCCSACRSLEELTDLVIERQVLFPQSAPLPQGALPVPPPPAPLPEDMF